MVDPEDAGKIVEDFKSYEEVAEPLPEDSARRYARSCLVHLFSKNTPDFLLDFLKTTIGGKTTRPEDVLDIEPEHKDESQTGRYPKNLAQVLIDLVEGRDPDEHLEELPAELATFITGLQAGAQGQHKEANDSVDALPVDSPFRERLEQFLRQQEARRDSKDPSPRGLRIADLGTFESSFDFDRDEVFAYCTNADRATAVFVHPIAVVRGDQIQILTEDKRRQLFPETGDVMAFAGAGHPRQPGRGEVGVWRVAEHQTEKATHFHLASAKRPVYEVRTVPFPSTDYDSVREFLKEYANRAGDNLKQPHLFQLSDGLLVGSRSERWDLSREEPFELGLFSWNFLSALRLDGRLFVVGPLPKEQGIYECAGLAYIVRKLFKPYIGGGKTAGRLTRAQLSELAQSLGSTGVGLDALRVQRIKGELERLGQHQEALEALVTELLRHSSVKQSIDSAVGEETAKQLATKTALLGDINRLQKERKEWEERIRQQREDHRKLRDETAKVVKAAFAKARTEGVATLAELAVFQALSASTSEPGGAGELFADRAIAHAGIVVRDLAPSDVDAISLFKSLGIPSQRATAFAAIGEVARTAGLIVCIRGVAARPAVEGWARAIAKSGVLVDSTVGLIDDSTFRGVLNRASTPDVLAVLDANLSALDVYARPLSDLVFSRLAGIDHWQPFILLALADGVAALPLPKTFEQVSVLLDLDARYAFHNVSDLDDLMSMATDPENGTFYGRLWRPAADRLRTQIGGLDPETQALVLSVLTTP